MKRITLLILLFWVLPLAAQNEHPNSIRQEAQRSTTLNGIVATEEENNALLQTSWTQNEPYNMMCPQDPVTNSSSYAGCPAVAMAQILNYLRTTQGTRFNDNDDYQHEYYGRNYAIDDDCDSLQFPSFTQLNQYLDECDSLFLLNEDLEGKWAAALTFASAVACQQVFTSEGSGTFSVQQAYNAYLRFGFSRCELHTSPTPQMYQLLIDNLANGYPAHLAIESPDGQAGHNVVVDGFRQEDSTFHFNFGYGGWHDGWYRIPDPNIPYNLTELEGIILNIIPETDDIKESARETAIEVFPNPTSGALTVKGDELREVSILDITGRAIASFSVSGNNAQLNLDFLPGGIYLIRATCKQGFATSKVLITHNTHR